MTLPSSVGLLLAAVQTFCNPMSIPDTPISHECWKLKHGDVIEKDKVSAWSYNSWLTSHGLQIHNSSHR